MRLPCIVKTYMLKKNDFGGKIRNIIFANLIFLVLLNTGINMYYTIKETRDALKKGEITSETLVNDSLNNFESDKSAPIPLNAFIEMF